MHAIACAPSRHQLLDVLPATQFSGIQVHVLQGLLDLCQGGLKGIKAGHGLLAFAPCSGHFLLLSSAALLVLGAYLPKRLLGLLLTPDGGIGALLQLPTHLVQLVEHVKTIVALQG